MSTHDVAKYLMVDDIFEMGGVKWLLLEKKTFYTEVHLRVRQVEQKGGWLDVVVAPDREVVIYS